MRPTMRKRKKPRQEPTPQTTTSGQESAPTRKQIAVRAYRLWGQESCSAGHHFEPWLQAKAQLPQTAKNS